jgi:hypothetical protein
MSPADLLPAQIHEALCALGKRDGVTIHLCTCEGSSITWQAIEALPSNARASGYKSRSGIGLTYDAALSACRAATFSGGKES